MKFNKAVRHRNIDDELFSHKEDPIFGNFIPEFDYFSDKRKQRTTLHPELKKMIYSNLPHLRDDRFGIVDEDSAQHYEDYSKLAINYYESKLKYLNDAFEN